MSVRGRAAAPAVAVEADPRTADPVTVAACEDVVVQAQINKTKININLGSEQWMPIKRSNERLNPLWYY